ncbi:cytochrome ubiquinol oxidase subunit I [Coxiella-like endosymbiont]|uniref:cytochrome ubiquinol oxidase subunit I n=1 Tax=Coxiella-like endosymbiont TaxID=1592897 RepID=UPI00272BBFD1|nr:cytochrome ubiquinol oxidase subunit I [Coxiella-like endosymbiont]
MSNLRNVLFQLGESLGFLALFVLYRSPFMPIRMGLQFAKYEPEKMAAIEVQWETQKPLAAWYIIVFPQLERRKKSFCYSHSYALSLIATHSLNTVVPGAIELMRG